MDILRQSACLDIINPITIYSYGVTTLIARLWVRPKTEWMTALA